MKRGIKSLLTRLPDVGLLHQTGQRVVVLCYHSIHPSRSYRSATPDQFEEHLRWLTGNCDLIRLSDLLDWRHDEVTGRPAVAITFDDGYRDNYEQAFPLLMKYRATATFFLTTGYIERSQTVLCEMRRLRNGQLDEMEPLGWSEIKEMRQFGMDFGAHTVNHPNLASLKSGQVREELAGSKQTLEDRLGERVCAMAYPFGKPGRHFTQETQRLVAEAGYELGAAVLFRSLKRSDSMLRLPRFFVTGDEVMTLRAKVLGGWDIIGLWQNYSPRWMAKLVSPRDFLE